MEKIKYMDIVYMGGDTTALKNGVWHKIEGEKDLYLFLGNWELELENFKPAAIIGNLKQWIIDETLPTEAFI